VVILDAGTLYNDEEWRRGNTSEDAVARSV
jgi:hypothetical protein